MKWTKWQLEFMNDHPEVFDEAEDPSVLFRRIGSFTKYHLNPEEAIVLVLGWVEARKYGVAFGGDIDNKGAYGTKRFKIYLWGPIVSDKFYFLSTMYDERLSKEQLFEMVKSSFEGEYLFPLSDLPYVYNGIKNLIMR